MENQKLSKELKLLKSVKSGNSTLEFYVYDIDIEEQFYNTLIDLLQENNLITKPVNYQDMVINMYE